MEVDLQKETNRNDQSASINELPNEILLKIFRKLKFGELLQATIVSHRWNELAFFLLQDRVLLRLDRWASEKLDGSQEWAPNRIYRVAIFRSTTFSRKLKPPVVDVVKLELAVELVFDGCWLDFLQEFTAIETLTLRIEQLVGYGILKSFPPCPKGLLPSLRHLTLRCSYVRIAGLLPEVAPRLVSLDLELLPRFLGNFFNCRFDCLESLTLRYMARACTWSLRHKQDLISFLRGLSTLRKLGLFVDKNETALDVAFALTSLEELILGGEFVHFKGDHFEGLSQMTNLRSLTIDVIAQNFSIDSTPVPTVETLVLKGTIYAKLPNLIVKCPNLKRLETSLGLQDDSDVQALVGSSWQNTMQELKIEISSFKPEVIACFGVLRKLRKLCLLHNAEPDDLEAFSALVASVDTLKELRLRLLFGKKWYASAAHLASNCGSCAIYIDEHPIEFYAAQYRN